MEPKAAETTDRPHWQFRPGQSGNPAGRPKGSRNRGSLFGRAIFDEKVAEVIVKGLAAALDGDKVMLRAAFIRALPAGKASPLEIEIPDGASPAELQQALDEAQRAMKTGELSPQEAAGVVAFVKGRQESQILALQLEEHALRVALLKQRLAGGEGGKSRATTAGATMTPEEQRLARAKEEEQRLARAKEIEAGKEAEKARHGLAGLSDEEIAALPREKKPPCYWTRAQLMEARGLPREEEDPVLRDLREQLRRTPLAELQETAARLRPDFLPGGGDAAAARLAA